MKTILFKTITAVFVLAIASSMQAAPPDYGKSGLMAKKYRAAESVADVKALKKGSRYALVCMECKTIDIKELASDEEAEALCHDGGTVHCDSCKREVKIKRSAGGKGAVTVKVTYLNDEGKECMFLVPIKD